VVDAGLYGGIYYTYSLYRFLLDSVVHVADDEDRIDASDRRLDRVDIVVAAFCESGSEGYKFL